jgi:MFS family permease
MKLDFSFRNLGRPFLFLWAGVTVSSVGSMLVAFGLNVWVFQHSRSVMAYSGMVVATVLPPLLVLPWTSVAADRVDRRYVLIASNGVAVIIGLVLAALLWSDQLEIWHLYAFNAAAALVSAFVLPAYQATVSALVPKDQLTRSIGLIGLSSGLLASFSPMAATWLLGLVGMAGIVLCDIATACIAAILIVKAITCMPPIEKSLSRKERLSIRHATRNLLISMSFFKGHRLMGGFLAYVVILNSLLALITTLLAPLVLSNHTANVLGLIMTMGSIGSLLGSGLLFISEKIKPMMKMILICDAILSICILAGGGFHSVGIYMVSAFIAMLAGSVAGGFGTSFWMRKVPLERQGSTFAVVGAITMIMTSIVVVGGGFIAENVLEPALSTHSIWVEWVGDWLGSSEKGQGLRLVFIMCGVLGVLLAFVALMHGRFRNMERYVPDCR